MRKLFFKAAGFLLAGALMLNGCSSGKEESGLRGPEEAARKEEALPFDFEVNAETFELIFQVNGEKIPVSGAAQKRAVEGYREEDGKVMWSYPEEQVRVEAASRDNYLEVKIVSETEGDNSFVWPCISADQYYLPLGEGKRVPADDAGWIEYLDQRQVSVMEEFSMPFWMAEEGDYCILFIMENPYRMQLDFSAEPSLSFAVSHEYPEIDPEKTNSYRIYVTKSGPVGGAKQYKNYVAEKGRLVTLEQKAQQNPNIRKLYGAPFIYLWGENIVSADDIRWENFRQAVGGPVMDYLCSFSDGIESGEEFKGALREIQGQDYVTAYQKNVICGYISQVLRREDFWNPTILKARNPQIDALLQKGSSLNDVQRLQLNKEALAANMEGVFGAVSDWMDASTVDLLSDMKQSGIDRAWIGLNSWEQAYAKPKLAETAEDMGYLMASYDSYHSIHAPGQEQWITACFEDASLYENATVTDKNGEKEKGFQNVGRKLNPALSLPAVKSRMERIMSNHIPFHSWFIDCDATGEIYDDYTPGHMTTQQQDLAARLERMAYIRDRYGLVIGSEGGGDFAASTIAFAHGIELKSFSWMDADMKSNQESEYYIGRYYNPAGGVAEHFSKRIPVKEQYRLVFVAPQYDVPLFKLVYNDSVITAAHWDWSTFKIKGATQDRMVREVLYNVPPLYHLDREQWEEYGPDMAAHHKVWSAFSSKAVRREMTDFAWLREDGTVQKTVYGDGLAAVANFGDTAYLDEKGEIPPHSVRIEEGGQSMVYTPALAESHR